MVMEWKSYLLEGGESSCIKIKQALKVLANEDALLLMMFLELRKLGNICCGHKMFLNKIRNIFCVRNKCCARGQTGKHLCRQQCVRNNVSSFARDLSIRMKRERVDGRDLIKE